MCSPGLLLLLVSTCLSVLSAQPDSLPSSHHDKGQPEQEPNENQQGMVKKFAKWIGRHPKTFGDVTFAILEALPFGKAVVAPLKPLLPLIPEGQEGLDNIKSGLKALDVKFDIFRADMKWDAGAGGAYQMTVNNIEKAWVKYNELGCSSKQTSGNKKKVLENIFFTFYSQYADSTLDLHQLLTAKPDSITKNLGDVLADKLRCHEKDITTQFLYLNKLMCKGNILNDKYYESKGANTEVRVNTAEEMASQSASALVRSHHRCISDSAAYIERDIFELIDDTKKHQKIADSIRDFLAKTYDRYDWMVFAFTTQNSKHKPDLVKRHIYSGFAEVERGTVTVAVAKQVKGAYTKAASVKQAIERCLSNNRICVNIPQKIRACRERVLGKELSQTYTAVHAYKSKSQTASTVVELPHVEDSELPHNSVSLNDPSLTPHLFTGECGKKFGKYTVLIKSDEEIMGVNPCSKVRCMNNSKCVVVSGTSIAVCECQYPFYGERCEKSLETYKRSLLQEPAGDNDAKAFCGSSVPR